MMINDDDISRATQKDCAPQILATAQLAPPLLAASGHIGDDDEDEDGDDDEDGDINIMTKCVFVCVFVTKSHHFPPLI